jgi:hypothetical protein
MFSSAVVALALAPCPAGVFGRDKPLPPVTVPAEAPYGYTYAPCRDLDLVARYPACRYDPQPGDVVLMSDTNALWTALYALALTGAPGHIGLVVRLPDGRLGMHEAGFNESLWTHAAPLDYRLSHYPGKVWVRRVRAPLTPWQDARLTEFVAVTEGTRYDLRTAKRQLTPFRSRGPLRTVFLGRPRGPGRPLICSEAVLEALVYAGAIDGRTARPVATFPRDLFFDRSLNPYINRHPPLAAGWDAPALWTPVLGVAAKGKDRGPVAGVVLPPPDVPQRTRRFRR